MHAPPFFSTPFPAPATLLHPHLAAGWLPAAWHAYNLHFGKPVVYSAPPLRIVQPRPREWRMSPRYEAICEEAARATRMRAAGGPVAQQCGDWRVIQRPILPLSGVPPTKSDVAAPVKAGQNPAITQQKCFYPPLPLKAKPKPNEVQLPELSSGESSSDVASEPIDVPARIGIEWRNVPSSTPAAKARKANLPGVPHAPRSAKASAVTRGKGLHTTHKKHVAPPLSVIPTAIVAHKPKETLSPISRKMGWKSTRRAMHKKPPQNEHHELSSEFAKMMGSLHRETFECLVCSAHHVGMRAHYEHMWSHV